MYDGLCNKTEILKTLNDLYFLTEERHNVLQ